MTTNKDFMEAIKAIQENRAAQFKRTWDIQEARPLPGKGNGSLFNTDATAAAADKLKQAANQTSSPNDNDKPVVAPPPVNPIPGPKDVGSQEDPNDADNKAIQTDMPSNNYNDNKTAAVKPASPAGSPTRQAADGPRDSASSNDNKFKNQMPDPKQTSNSYDSKYQMPDPKQTSNGPNPTATVAGNSGTKGNAAAPAQPTVPLPRPLNPDVSAPNKKTVVNTIGTQPVVKSIYKGPQLAGPGGRSGHTAVSEQKEINMSDLIKSFLQLQATGSSNMFEAAKKITKEETAVDEGKGISYSMPSNVSVTKVPEGKSSGIRPVDIKKAAMGEKPKASGRGEVDTERRRSLSATFKGTYAGTKHVKEDNVDEAFVSLKPANKRTSTLPKSGVEFADNPNDKIAAGFGSKVNNDTPSVYRPPIDWSNIVKKKKVATEETELEETSEGEKGTFGYKFKSRKQPEAESESPKLKKNNAKVLNKEDADDKDVKYNLKKQEDEKFISNDLYKKKTKPIGGDKKLPMAREEVSPNEFGYKVKTTPDKAAKTKPVAEIGAKDFKKKIEELFSEEEMLHFLAVEEAEKRGRGRPKKTADDDGGKEEPSHETNIISAARKAMGGSTVTFKHSDGGTSSIDPAKGRKISSKIEGLPNRVKADTVQHLHKTPKHLSDFAGS